MCVWVDARPRLCVCVRESISVCVCVEGGWVSACAQESRSAQSPGRSRGGVVEDGGPT